VPAWQQTGKKGDTVKSITVKGKVVNGGEVETQFTGKNMTPIGGIKLFDKFARKLGVERALEQSMKLPRKERKYGATAKRLCMYCIRDSA
jgi:hypothetical protein